MVSSKRHGGAREGAGRKPVADKKRPISVYLEDDLRNRVESLRVPGCKSTSEKFRKLIEIGLVTRQEKLMKRKDEVRFIDLFCGLGGIRIGFSQALEDAGYKPKCVFSSDIKPAAITAYKNYFDEDAFCDITKVEPEELPDFEYLLAGFPCQAFSQAGLGLGFEDTRGTLFFDIAKILKARKPKGFLLENVEGLVIHDKGKTFKIITKTLNELGYSIAYAVLDGKDFGLAQSRRRIYIIGKLGESITPLEDFDNESQILEDVIDYSIPPKDTKFTRRLLKHYKIEDLYGKAIKDKRGGSNNIHSWDIELFGRVNQTQRDLLSALLKARRNKKWAEIIGIKWMDGMPLTESMIQTFFPHPRLKELLDDLVRKGYLAFEHPKQQLNGRRVEDTSLPKGYNIVSGKLSFEYAKILNPKEVSPTIVATDVHKLAVPVKGGFRPLTISEGLKLFGFPDDYDLSFLKEAEAFDLLGNTVCVPVIRAVSSRLLKDK